METAIDANLTCPPMLNHRPITATHSQALLPPHQPQPITYKNLPQSPKYTKDLWKLP